MEMEEHRKLPNVDEEKKDASDVRQHASNRVTRGKATEAIPEPPPIYAGDGELVSDLLEDVDFRPIQEVKVRRWTTQKLGELLRK